MDLQEILNDETIQVFVKGFIVEYDLPTDTRRLRFYRKIKRFKEDNEIPQCGWSTQSVVFTESSEFAWEVYKQARAVGGVAHVYEARRLSKEKWF